MIGAIYLVKDRKTGGARACCVLCVKVLKGQLQLILIFTKDGLKFFVPLFLVVDI